jgi:hypothetical protein
VSEPWSWSNPNKILSGEATASGTTMPALVRLYSSGASLATISTLTALPKERIRLLLHDAGVKMRHTHQIYHEPIMELNYESALLLGLHAGDGHLSEDWGISISSRDKSMGEQIVSLARSVLGVEPGIYYQGDSYFVVRSAKSQVFEFFEHFGFTRGRKATTVGIPPLVASSTDLRVIVGFLKGTFSADGCFSFRGRWGQCRFVVSSTGFRDGFVELAKKLGFGFRSYSYPHRTGHNKLPLNTAYVGNFHQVSRWMETVGSISDTHLRRYQVWRSKCF